MRESRKMGSKCQLQAGEKLRTSPEAPGDPAEEDLRALRATELVTGDLKGRQCPGRAGREGPAWGSQRQRVCPAPAGNNALGW